MKCNHLEMQLAQQKRLQQSNDIFNDSMVNQKEIQIHQVQKENTEWRNKYLNSEQDNYELKKFKDQINSLNEDLAIYKRDNARLNDLLKQANAEIENNQSSLYKMQS